MAFRFKVSEPFEKGCKRIAREQFERAQSQLKDGSDEVVAVHETRKALKRLRALLRLVRPALGDGVFRNENASLRDVARSLSGARDRHVLLETVLKLEGGPETARKGICGTVRDVINRTNGGDHGVEPSAVKKATSALAEAERRFMDFKFDGEGFEIVGPGLRASYHKGRRAFRKAYANSTDENFHEWRKGAQQHWRHMLLLSRAWPASLNARVSEARAISQLLGDDHDLALLIAFARAQPESVLGAEHAAEIEVLARERQNELRTLARPKGARLFAENAKSLHDRMADYWKSAVALDSFGVEEEQPKKPARSVRRAPSRRRRSAARAT
jgi:CHAD domain-containing protein